VQAFSKVQLFASKKRDYATVFYSIRKFLKLFCIMLIILRVPPKHSAILKPRITTIIRISFLTFHLFRL